MKVREEIRFWSKVQMGTPSDCWLWTGTLGRQGYGHFHITGGGSIAPYRYAYAQLVGPPPDGVTYTLDHLCRNRACVNPAHLEVVTRGENVLRGESLPAQNARKTHCKHGHEFTPENTYITPRQGWRYCRTCLRASDARRAERAREKAVA